MEHVKLRAGPSPIHGTGCFAEEDIAQDRLVATWFDNLEILSERAYLEELGSPNALRSGVRLIGPWFALSKDPSQVESTDFVNHSDDPNLRYFFGCLVAKNAIAAGEELFLDYRALNSKDEFNVVNGWTASRALRAAAAEMLGFLRSKSRALLLLGLFLLACGCSEVSAQAPPLHSVFHEICLHGGAPADQPFDVTLMTSCMDCATIGKTGCTVKRDDDVFHFEGFVEVKAMRNPCPPSCNVQVPVACRLPALPAGWHKVSIDGKKTEIFVGGAAPKPNTCWSPTTPTDTVVHVLWAKPKKRKAATRVLRKLSVRLEDGQGDIARDIDHNKVPVARDMKCTVESSGAAWVPVYPFREGEVPVAELRWPGLRMGPYRLRIESKKPCAVKPSVIDVFAGENKYVFLQGEPCK